MCHLQNICVPLYGTVLSSLRFVCGSGVECTTVEFYLYPTVGTVLIHSAKPELTEYWTLSNTVDVQTELCLALMVSIGRIVTYKIFINKQLIYANVTIRLALFIYINIGRVSTLEKNFSTVV